jgi:PhnB protein
MSFLFRFGYEDPERARNSSTVRSIEGASSTTIEGREDMAVQPVPEGYNTVSPYLAVDDAEKAIEYYTTAFGAEETVRMNGPDGRIGHAELKIGDSHVMLSDPFPQSTTTPPKELGGTSGSIFMYVDDVDAVVQKAVDAGATVTMEVEDQFWATASARSPTRSATRGRSRRTSRI